jgi:predicted nucleotidyltransferase
MLNRQYKDILSILSEKKVKFILVGAYAMAVQGYHRSTMGIDLLVMPEPGNASLVLQALGEFGAPVRYLAVENLQKEGFVLQVGISPCRIYIFTSIDGVKFKDAFTRSKMMKIEGIPVHVLSVPDLIINKKATGRAKDLADVKILEKGK